MDSYSDEVLSEARDLILHDIQCSAQRYLKTGVADSTIEQAAEDIYENGQLYRLLAFAFCGDGGVKVLDGLKDVLAPEDKVVARCDADAIMEMERRADERRIMGES